MLDTLVLKPVVARTLSDEAAEQLRDAIRRGTLTPGTRLVERDLAERMRMSRIPIREALHRLVDEGLVKKVPHRGIFVYTPTYKEIEEIASLRVTLERLVVERVIPRWKPEHEVRLRELVDHMRGAASERDFHQLYELDFRFHNTLWAIAEHTLLLEVVSGLRSRINRFLYETASATPSFRFDIYIAAHEELIEVLRSGDIAAAQAAITKHCMDSVERILAHYRLFEAMEKDPSQRMSADLSP